MREVDVHTLAARLERGEPTCLVDVREPWEVAIAEIDGSLSIPLGELASRVGEVAAPDGALVVTICHHGVRSLSAAQLLEAAGAESVCSLAGGIDAWARLVDPSLARY